MTSQQQHIYEYIQEFGFAYPAKLIGRTYKDKIFPAELSKRCRELRARGILQSHQDGKFEKFYLPRMKKVMIMPDPFKPTKPQTARLI